MKEYKDPPIKDLNEVKNKFIFIWLNDGNYKMWMTNERSTAYRMF